MLINWTIDDYVTLDRAQQSVLDEQLDEYLSWHQTTQLPQYVALLDDVLQHLEYAAPVTEAVLTRWQERADSFAADLQYRAVDWIVPMAQTASDKQRQSWPPPSTKSSVNWNKNIAIELKISTAKTRLTVRLIISQIIWVA